MGDDLPERRNLEETWTYLEEQRGRMPRDEDGRPYVPPCRPATGDEGPFGFRWFRSGVYGMDVSGCTLPRTYISRSELKGVCFRNTDLSESWLCWNDFVDCDFSDADLRGCDLRASIFRGCKFVRACLAGCDLRRSVFEGCDFSGADLTGAVGDYPFADRYDLYDSLDDDQQGLVEWQDDPGPEPEGG